MSESRLSALSVVATWLVGVVWFRIQLARIVARETGSTFWSAVYVKWLSAPVKAAKPLRLALLLWAIGGPVAVVLLVVLRFR